MGDTLHVGHILPRVFICVRNRKYNKLRCTCQNFTLWRYSYGYCDGSIFWVGFEYVYLCNYLKYTKINMCAVFFLSPLLKKPALAFDVIRSKELSMRPSFNLTCDILMTLQVPRALTQLWNYWDYLSWITFSCN